MPTGVYITKEYRELKRKIALEKGYGKWLIGRISNNKGKKMSEEARNKMRKNYKYHINSGCFGKRKINGENNPNWKGGKHIDEKGYVLVFCPNHPHPKSRNYVYEHRLIIEKQIGHYLLPSEQCHHLGTKDDNRPQMLILFSNISAHSRFHKNPNNIKSEEIIFDGRKL